MYIYAMKAMPGCKAKFEGDVSVRYEVRRKQTSASAQHKSTTAVIRTDLSYVDALALVKRFNDKELEARAIKIKEDSRAALNV